jgi:hypothetical protein|eukprot:COSAG06_NODE_4872_length_3890_cov_1.434186_6_plen_76_part_00
MAALLYLFSEQVAQTHSGAADHTQLRPQPIESLQAQVQPLDHSATRARVLSHARTPLGGGSKLPPRSQMPSVDSS